MGSDSEKQKDKHQKNTFPPLFPGFAFLLQTLLSSQAAHGDGGVVAISLSAPFLLHAFALLHLGFSKGWTGLRSSVCFAMGHTWLPGPAVSC